MLGSSRPIAFDEANIRSVLARPGVLEDISSAYDSPATTVDDWIDVIRRQTWMTGDAVARLRAGPLITDDRPRPEYFLLRRLFGAASHDPFFSLDRGAPHERMSPPTTPEDG